MKCGKCNLVVGGILLVLVGFGGFLLGYTLDPLVTDSYYKMSYARLLFRGAHSHGMLFGFFNLLIGLLISRLALSDKGKQWLSVFGLIALALPVALLLRGITHPSKVFLPLGAIGGLAFIIANVFILIGAAKLKTQKNEVD